MPAVPYRQIPRGGPRIDARVVDRVVLSFERNVFLFPKRAHDRHMLLGSAAAVSEILVQTDELHFVPSHTDGKPEPSLAQHIQTGGLHREQSGLALRHGANSGRKSMFRSPPGHFDQNDKRSVE